MEKAGNGEGSSLLAEQGRMTLLAGAPERIAAIAKDYAAKPENTIITTLSTLARVC